MPPSDCRTAGIAVRPVFILDAFLDKILRFQLVRFHEKMRAAFYAFPVSFRLIAPSMAASMIGKYAFGHSSNLWAARSRSLSSRPASAGKNTVPPGACISSPAGKKPGAGEAAAVLDVRKIARVNVHHFGKGATGQP